MPFVGGRLVRSGCEASVEVINPSNGARLLAIPAGCDADVDHAVISSCSAFEDGRWSDTPPSFKRKVLEKLADLIALQGPTLDALDAEEMGKPVGTAVFNASSAAELMRFYAYAIDKVLGDVYTSDDRSLVLQRRVPRGIVAAVVPWNFPTFNAVLKIAPALAAGNCTVLKPSELASRSALRLAELALEAGLPEAVLNVVPGLGETVGRALGLHPKVAMVAFTGSTEVGKLFLQYSGQSNMKVVLAECGGKSPQIVFNDGVDLEAAAATIASSLLINQGQVCSIGSRLLVQRSIEAVVIEKIALRLKEIVIGDALDHKTTYGPLVSAKQLDRVMSYVEGAQTDGAQLVRGGRRTATESGGYFIEPTILRNVSPALRIAQEEVFGPVLSVIPFDDEQDAIRIANATVYGLAAYVWTSNLSTAMRMAKAMRSTVLINGVPPRGEGPGHAGSWEPAGQSGLGTEGGLAGMESYLRRQLVWISHA
jgi:acyl-CoA reductase-like NAD-dependent aldehyde dehydrogenase